MDLVLIRHSAPAVAPDICYGASDVPLVEAPDDAAQRLLERIRALGVPAPRVVVSSPLSRCAAIAGRIAQRLRIPVTHDERLREIDFGAWEGVRWSEIGAAALDRWAADLMHAREHGGESAAQLVARVRPVLEGPHAGMDVDWRVTHAGVIRALASIALREPLRALLERPIAFGGVVWLSRDAPDAGGTGAWKIVHWDE